MVSRAVDEVTTVTLTVTSTIHCSDVQSLGTTGYAGESVSGASGTGTGTDGMQSAAAFNPNDFDMQSI